MEPRKLLSVRENQSVRDPLGAHVGRQYPYVRPMIVSTSDLIEDFAIRNKADLPWEVKILDINYANQLIATEYARGVLFGSRMEQLIKETKVAYLAEALGGVSNSEMLLETCFANIGAENRRAIEANSALKEAVEAYFKGNNYFKPAVDCVAYLMTPLPHESFRVVRNW